VPDTQFSFVTDSLLLLFHHAYFALLPRLEKGGRPAERDELVSAFFGFAERVPDVAERYRIAGLAYEAMKDATSAVASFEKALVASHVDDHVFMTRLQTLWMALLDKGDFEAALQLLLKLMPMVPLKHLAELRELILATFQEYGSARHEGRAAGWA
jgi:tetratricopeptide (TPR) repeat protein